MRKPHTAETLLAKCKPEGDCMIWQGVLNGTGYPRVTVKGVRISARDLLMRLLEREKPFPTAVVRATCGKKACMNEDHLRWGKRKEAEEPDEWEKPKVVVILRREHMGNPFAGLMR